MEDRNAWFDWLRGVLADLLAGTGLRPEVTFVPETDRCLVRIVCPLEWRVDNWVDASALTLDKAVEIVEAVLAFFREAWPERMCDDRQYELFRRIPGSFTWTTEQAPEILYRVTLQQLTQRYGPRSVTGITTYEDLLVVHTRWAGDFSIGIDNYRKRLEEVAHAMRAFMRKPLRHQYLYQLRHGKKPEK